MILLVTPPSRDSRAIFAEVPPDADVRLNYGSDAHQFGDLRLPKSPGLHPVVVNIHGGYWRAKYDLTHAGHLCAALASAGAATWNLEYRRIGNGGGWPRTFQDVVAGFLYLQGIAEEYRLDLRRLLVIGHSAGAQLALCLAAQQPTLRNVLSIAGVIDLKMAWHLRLSHGVVAEYLGGTPAEIPEHYKEASPIELPLTKVRQRILYGVIDEIAPQTLSRDYFKRKREQQEDVQLIELSNAGHFEVIDPRSDVWPLVQNIILQLLD